MLQYDRYQTFSTEEFLMNQEGGCICPAPNCGQGIWHVGNDNRVTCRPGCGVSLLFSTSVQTSSWFKHNFIHEEKDWARLKTRQEPSPLYIIDRQKTLYIFSSEFIISGPGFLNVNVAFIVCNPREFSGLYKLHPWYWNSLLYGLISSGESSAHFLQLMPFTIFPVFIPPGTHHCWVDRGGMV